MNGIKLQGVFLILIFFFHGCSGYQNPSTESGLTLNATGAADTDNSGDDDCSCAELTPKYDPEQDPNNVYLDMCVESEWFPGMVGAERAGWHDGGVADADCVPVQNNGALGPPGGLGAYSSSGTYTCVGINGSAVWRFNEDYYIHDGEGADFVTFSSVFAWGSVCDGLCCELSHIEVSEDLVEWYYNSEEEYDVNPEPDTDNSGYSYFNVKNMHGNNPVWANSELNVQAQDIEEINGVKKWVDIPDVCVSRYFKPGDPYLGGVEFDLSVFRSKDDDSPWPAEGRMRYLRIIDDSEILDGQDYLKDWCLGANMMSAMALNFAPR